MAGKVFISCGQNSPDERGVTLQISDWFRAQGFNPYVAIQIQNILELNTGIISEIKTSDYYLFINFRREKLRHRWLFPSRRDFYRGSLYTNQELAIAFALSFDRMIFVNQLNTRREGIFGFIVVNTPEFDDFNQVLPIVQQAVADAGWLPTYSRNLEFRNLRWTGPFYYEDSTGIRNVRALHIDILNNRPDLGASNCVLRLNQIAHNGAISTSPDRSHLKCKGFSGYNCVIWPSDLSSFDLLSVDVANPSHIYLHSEADFHPRNPIINANGQYNLTYQVIAEKFPLIEFTVSLDVTGNYMTTTANLVV